MTWKWKNVSATISVSEHDLPRTFGTMRRNGKLYFRNYKRTLKNAMGLNLADIIAIRSAEVEKNIMLYVMHNHRTTE